MNEPRQFPILQVDRRESPPPHSVPWEWLAQFEEQAKDNHRQSLEELAARGGMAWAEILAVASGLNLVAASNLSLSFTSAQAQHRVLGLVVEWEKKQATSPALAVLPPPKPGTGTPTWELVIADMKARDAMGTQKYRQRHRHDNGREHLVDAYQEVLDLACYVRAEIERRTDERKRAAGLIRAWAGQRALSPEDGLSVEALARQIEEA